MGEAEATLHQSNLLYEKVIWSSSSTGNLRIEFCNAMYSKNCSEMLQTVANSVAAFIELGFSQHN